MEIKGLSGVVSELRAFGKDMEKRINAETEGIANQIAKDAKTLAPKNFGKLAQSISVASDISSKGAKQVVYVNELYGAYMEFGTGTKVNVPAEFADMAKSFKGQKVGDWKKGLESIKIWCRAKGIDEKFAYPIFAKILGAGVTPQPFLYPAWVKGKADYVKNLQKLLDKTKKKI